jgi:hypothetical protein
MYDLSREFEGLVTVFQSQNVNVTRPISKIAPRSTPLLTLSKAVSSQVREATALVLQLRRLCEARGLFLDPTADINSCLSNAKSILSSADAAMGAFLQEISRLSASASKTASTSGAAMVGILAEETGWVSKASPFLPAGGLSAPSTIPAGPSASAIPVVLRMVSVPSGASGTRRNAFYRTEYMSFKAQCQRLVAEAHANRGAQPLDEMLAMAAAAPAGSMKQHWSIVSETLKQLILAANKGMQEALRIRSDNLKEQTNQRKLLARSTWAPVVAGGGTLVDTPLFDSPKLLPPPIVPPAPAGNAGQKSVASPFALKQSDLVQKSAITSKADMSGGFNYGANASSLKRRHGTATGASGMQSVENGAGASALQSRSAMPAAGSYSYTSQQLERYKDASSRAAEVRQVRWLHAIYGLSIYIHRIHPHMRMCGHAGGEHHRGIRAHVYPNGEPRSRARRSGRPH